MFFYPPCFTVASSPSSLRVTVNHLKSDKIDFLPKPYNYYFAKYYAEFLKLDNIPDLLKKYR